MLLLVASKTAIDEANTAIMVGDSQDFGQVVAAFKTARRFAEDNFIIWHIDAMESLAKNLQSLKVITFF